MFTKNQIEEIKQKLQLDGAKDTEFPDVNPVSGKEILALVQEGINKKMSLKEFARYVSKFVEGGSGGGTVDPAIFDATIAAYESEIATAEVDYEDTGVFSFRLGLPRGAQGTQGEIGPIGPVGPQGERGEKGEKGDPGDVAVGSFTAMIFKTSTTVPDKPVGGTWNIATNVFTPPTGWSITENLERPIWASVKVFYTDSSLNGEWSEPFQISGNDGEKGADGVSTEFVYKRSETFEKKPTLPEDQTNWTPEQDNWTDDPTGVDESYECEWVITRKLLDDGSWSVWKGPSLWAKWGEIGQDGAGVEYIYYIDDTGLSPSNPTPNDYETNTEYQDPYNEYDASGLGWTDNPTGVSSTKKYEWVCVRKRRDGKWGPYSEPALWSHYGEEGLKGTDGYRVRILYISTETTSEYPSYGETDSITEMHSRGWSESFPTDYNEDTVVWATDNYLDINGNIVDVWTTPRIITGIKGTMDIPLYYNTTFYTTTSGEGIMPSIPTVGISIDSTITSKDAAGETCTWFDYPNDSSKQWYQCVAKVNTETSLIVSWSAVSVWNGKDGTAMDGKQWDIRVAITDSYDTPPAVNQNNVDPNEGIEGSPWMVITKDSVFTVPEGGRMWEIRAQLDSNGNLISGWCLPYPISGERGPKGDTGPAGAPGANGTAGVAGISYEERYMIGTEESTDIPWDDSYKYLRLPDGWSTTIPKTTIDNPYIWCIKARITGDDVIEGGSWEGPFKLSGTNGIDGIDGINATPTTVGILTNPTDTVVCDPDGNVLTDLPIETTLRIFDGNTEKSVIDFGYEILNDASQYVTVNSNIDTATLSITKLAIDAPRSISIKVYGKSEDSDVVYYQIFTLKKLSSSDLPIQADLNNESTSIPATPDNELLNNEVYNTFSMYVGTSSQLITNLYLSNKSGVQINNSNIVANFVKNSEGYYTGEFTLILANEAFLTNTLVLYITGICNYEGSAHSRTKAFKIVRLNNGEDSVWCELNISRPAIIANKDKDNNLIDPNPNSLEVKVNKHKGSLIETYTVEEILSLDNCIVTYTIDDGTEEVTLSDSIIDVSSLIENKDLEEKLTFTLSKDSYTLDKETIPILTNGLGATSYKLAVSTDIIQYGEDGNISNIEPDESGNKYINCNVIVQIPEKEPLTINTLDLKNEYLDGFDLEYVIDGITYSYVPGDKILANSVNESISFKLRYVLTEPDFLWDYKTIMVMKPQKGDRGQIVYPAGTYNIDATYTTNDKVAPYVLDTLDGKFYVLNAIMDWIGSEQPDGYNTPSTNYQDGQNINAVWEPFEMFEAIYADIGVFNQALVGSAVFYKQFIFSQNGKDADGAFSNHYEYFGQKTDGTYVEEDELDTLLDRTDLKFYPSLIFNVKTGAGWLAGKAINWNKDGELIVKSINGKTISIEDGVNVGPWKTFSTGTTTYIGDGDTFEDSTNVFGNDGTFKVGGDYGIKKTETSDNSFIELGDNVKFTSTSVGLTEADLTNWWNSTTISGGKIETGTITTQHLAADAIQAENIKGETITGISIKSDNDFWNIGNTGAGWVANKNIEWNANGDITIKGKITTTEGSQVGIWHVWDDDTISTSSDSSASDTAMILFKPDGSGHLCYKNISWDTNGNLYLGKLNGDTTVTIGDGTWVTTSDGGIKAVNNNALFNKDGSGYIGGIDNNETCKGISWNKEGDFTFHGKAKHKPQFIVLTGEEDDDTTPDNIRISLEENMYIFKKSDVASYNIAEDGLSSDYLNVYLKWFSNDLSGLLQNGEVYTCSLINHSDTILDVNVSDDKLILPFREILDPVVPQNNYKLYSNDNFDKWYYIIQSLYILPGSKLVLNVEKYNDIITFYIDNIADFKLAHKVSDGDYITNLSLITSNYDLNTNYANNDLFILANNTKYSNIQETIDIDFGTSIEIPYVLENCGTSLIVPTYRYSLLPVGGDFSNAILNVGNNYYSINNTYNSFNFNIHTVISPLGARGVDGTTDLNTFIGIKTTESISANVILVLCDFSISKRYYSNPLDLSVSVGDNFFSFTEEDYFSLCRRALNSPNRELKLGAFIIDANDKPSDE